MTLEVNPDSLVTFGDRLTELSGKVTEAKNYLKKNVANLGWTDSGLIGQLLWVGDTSAIQGARGVISDNFDTMKKVLDASAKEIASSAAMYRMVDHERAEELDNTYPDGE